MEGIEYERNESDICVRKLDPKERETEKGRFKVTDKSACRLLFCPVIESMLHI